MHGILDYATAGALFALPRMFGWSEHVTTLLTVLAIATVIYSLITRCELGAFKAIPMRGHLLLDFMSGALLCAAALMLRDEPDGVRLALGMLGLFEIGAALLTDPTPSPAATPTVGRTRSPGL